MSVPSNCQHGKALVCITFTTALEWAAGKGLTSINMASARAALAVSSASLGTTPHSWLKICSSCGRRSRIIFNVPSCCITVRRIEQSLPLIHKSQRRNSRTRHSGHGQSIKVCPIVCTHVANWAASSMQFGKDHDFLCIESKVTTLRQELALVTMGLVTPHCHPALLQSDHKPAGSFSPLH